MVLVLFFLCVVEPAMFVAAFNDEDPGVDSIAQRCAFNCLATGAYLLI
jgi:hypothetical protein